MVAKLDHDTIVDRSYRSAFRDGRTLVAGLIRNAKSPSAEEDFRPQIYTDCYGLDAGLQSRTMLVRARRRKSVAFFITLGACLVALAVALNVGWIILNLREVVLLVLGIIFFLVLIF